MLTLFSRKKKSTNEMLEGINTREEEVGKEQRGKKKLKCS